MSYKGVILVLKPWKFVFWSKLALNVLSEVGLARKCAVYNFRNKKFILFYCGIKRVPQTIIVCLLLFYKILIIFTITIVTQVLDIFYLLCDVPPLSQGLAFNFNLIIILLIFTFDF